MQTLPAVRRLNDHAVPARPEGRASIDVRAISRPARVFTGDFYLAHRTGERLWIAVGDVAGKGLPAAIVMAMIQEELERRIASCAAADCDPAQTMLRLHEFLAPLLPRNRFATAVIGWLDDDGTLTLANAGHPSPLIVREGGAIEEIRSTGPILGVLPQARWRSTRTRLERGDALVLYSDGVSEALVEGCELGVGGIREHLTRATPEALLEKIESADDVTLVVVRR